MFEAVAKQVAALRIPLDRLIAAGVVASFLWLLLQDRIQPLAVYLLQLYLTL
jgi:hypothetical protein